MVIKYADRVLKMLLTGKLITAECNKLRNALPECVHCEENQPANYRRCMMQKIKEEQTKKTSLPKQPQRA